MSGSPSLRVVIVSGIYPPDIGGPATHAFDLANELRRRKAAVRVLALTDEPQRQERAGAILLPRRWPWWLRLGAVCGWLVRHRREYDVIYATGLHPAAVAASHLARRPVVVKIVGDPAWERSSRLGLVDETFDNYQQQLAGGARDAAMRAVRDWSVRKATKVIAPSEYLRRIVEGWKPNGEVQVIPNGVHVPAEVTTSGPVVGTRPLQVVSVGRLVAHKHVDVLIDAVADTVGIELVIVGDGPDRKRLEALARRRRPDAVHFIGSVGHDEVLRMLGEGDLLASASGYEGLPHVVLEALALGTPVISADAGGTREAVFDDDNGRLLSCPDAATFAKIFAGLRDDGDELERLSAGARRTGEKWRFENCADQIEGLLGALTRRRPRVINLSRGALSGGPGIAIQRKCEIVTRHLDATFVVSGKGGLRHLNGVRIVELPSVRPWFLGALFGYSTAPAVALALAAAKSGTAVVCQSPYEAATLLTLRRLLPRKRRPRVVVEVHGDWRTASRLYGGSSRRLIAPVADAIAAWSVRGADRVRVIGEYTEGLVRGAGRTGSLERYVAYSDFSAFLDPPAVPLTEARVVMFIGVLERYKAPDVLLRAWALVVSRLDNVRLKMVGAGPLEPSLRRQSVELGIDSTVEFIGPVPQDALVPLLDGARCLAIPSPSEGLGRVVLEAMARGRPVVGTAVGGIPELVEDGMTGRLVPPGDPAALADALVDLLSDDDTAAAMGIEARRRAEERDPAAEYEAGLRRLAEWVSVR